MNFFKSQTVFPFVSVVVGLVCLFTDLPRVSGEPAEVTLAATNLTALPTNLAQGKTATASGGNAKLVIDGNTNGEYFDGSVLEASGPNAWWQIDLGSVKDIETLKLWNRTDCCSNRLRQFTVFVSNEPFVSTDLIVTKRQPGVWSYYHPEQGGFPSALFIGQNGRYVRVQQSNTDALNLAEVQVFGSETPLSTALRAELAVSRTDRVWKGGEIVELSARTEDVNVTQVEFRANAKLLGTVKREYGVRSFNLPW
jgi:hypothetical protein